jgi:hypothetical protein
MSDAITQEDADRHNFWVVYRTALNALAGDPESACEAMGNHNAPWEIQHDIMDYADLSDSEALALGEDQRTGIFLLDEGLRQLPADAIAPAGALMTSREGCLQAMCHPAWEPLRQQAVHLAALLEPAFDRTKNYFYPD